SARAATREGAQRRQHPATIGSRGEARLVVLDRVHFALRTYTSGSNAVNRHSEILKTVESVFYPIRGSQVDCRWATARDRRFVSSARDSARATNAGGHR